MLGNIKDEGIILNVKDFRENDKKVDIFLSNNGIITAVAYGAKKSKKRFGGNLDPYNLGEFEILSTKKGFYLKEVSVKRIFTNIKSNIVTLTMLFNITKLIVKVPSNNKMIYKALLKILMKMESSNLDLKYYFFFLIYFLKKEGLFSLCNCYFCNSHIIDKLVIKNGQLVFMCKNCDNNIADLVDLQEDELSFLISCLNLDKNFERIKYNEKIFYKLEMFLIEYIREHFHLTLEKLPKIKANT